MPLGIYLALAAGLTGGGQTALPFTPASTPFDNAVARVELSTAAPNSLTRPHVHLTNRVMIYFEDGRNDITFQNGTVHHEVFRAGDVQWNDAMGTHTAYVTGPAPVDIVHIELKSPPHMVPAVKYAARDPLKVSPEHYKVEIDNNQVRVLRLHLEPGQKVALHDEPFEQLLVPLTPVRLKVADSTGGSKTVTYKQAALQWLSPGTEADENIGDGPCEAIIVEFKK